MDTRANSSFSLSLHDLRQLSPGQETRYLTNLFDKSDQDKGLDPKQIPDPQFFVLLTRSNPVDLRNLASSYLEDATAQLDVVTGLTVNVQDVFNEVSQDYQQILELRHVHSLLYPFKGFIPTLFSPILHLLKVRSSNLGLTSYSESTFGHCPRLHVILQLLDLFGSGSGSSANPNSIDPKVPVLLSRLRLTPAQTVLSCLWISQMHAVSCIDVLQLSLFDVQPLWAALWRTLNSEVSMGVH